MPPPLQPLQRQIGIAKEAVYGTGVVPTDFIPYTKPPKFKDIPVTIMDPGGRGNAAKDQGFYQGVLSSDSSLETWFYPGLTTHFLMAMMGTDTVTGTAAKTGTIGAVAAGVVTLTYTLVGGAAPVVGDIFMLDSGLPTEEQVVPTVVTGAGPYTLTVPATKYAHLAAAPAASMWSHALTMANQVPSYTYTDFYGLTGGTPALQYPGCLHNQVSLKWASNGPFIVLPSSVGFPSVPVAKPTAGYTANWPLISWQAVLTLAGVANPRLVTLDLDLKRPSYLQYGANGLQTPNNGTVGLLEVSGKMGFAIIDDTERQYFRQNTQPVTSMLFTSGAKTLLIQITKTAFLHTSEIDTSQGWALFNASFSGVYSVTDAGPIKFVAVDGRSTGY